MSLHVDPVEVLRRWWKTEDGEWHGSISLNGAPEVRVDHGWAVVTRSASVQEQLNQLARRVTELEEQQAR